MQVHTVDGQVGKVMESRGILKAQKSVNPVQFYLSSVFYTFLSRLAHGLREFIILRN